jgi:hypothetical protein
LRDLQGNGGRIGSVENLKIHEQQNELKTFETGEKLFTSARKHHLTEIYGYKLLNSLCAAITLAPAPIFTDLSGLARENGEEFASGCRKN